ncbi:MAG: DUF202 domain-containing protein [Thermomicrobiales bacterium]
MCIVFAVLLFSSGSNDNSLVEPVGIVAIIVGVILLAYAYVQYRGSRIEAGQQTPEAPRP